MKLSGLHLLLTFQCTFECDHCFVFGSPFQTGVMTLSAVRHILDEAQTCPSVNSIYFEGGEPFLYYAVFVEGVRLAKQHGYSVGVVSNSYWATSVEDAAAWLKPSRCTTFHTSATSLRCAGCSKTRLITNKRA